MQWNRLGLAIALAALVAAAVESPVAASASFGSFPIYPHAKIVWPGSASVPGYVLESHDSIATIDGWYRSKLPATCQRSVLASHGKSGIEYICRGTPRAILDIVPDSGKIDIHAEPL